MFVYIHMCINHLGQCIWTLPRDRYSNNFLWHFADLSVEGDYIYRARLYIPSALGWVLGEVNFIQKVKMTLEGNYWSLNVNVS